SPPPTTEDFSPDDKPAGAHERIAILRDRPAHGRLLAPLPAFRRLRPSRSCPSSSPARDQLLRTRAAPQEAGRLHHGAADLPLPRSESLRKPLEHQKPVARPLLAGEL